MLWTKTINYCNVWYELHVYFDYLLYCFDVIVVQTRVENDYKCGTFRITESFRYKLKHFFHLSIKSYGSQ